MAVTIGVSCADAPSESYLVRYDAHCAASDGRTVLRQIGLDSPVDSGASAAHVVHMNG